jgi:sialidase-1
VATCFPRTLDSALRIVALPTLVAGGLPVFVSASTVDTVVLVDNGVPTAQAIIEGTWTQGEGELSGRGLAAIIEGKVGVGTGDFHVSARFTMSDHPANRAGFLLGEDSNVGLSTPSAARIYVSGFLFGNLTTELKTLSSYGPPGTEITLEFTRVGDHTVASINGDTVWAMPYESDRTVGPVAIRAGNTATMHLRDFRFVGSPLLLEEWVHPYDRDYSLLPNSVDVFIGGEGGYHTYRIPAIVRAHSGALLAFCEGRKNSASDYGDIDLLLRRSLDGGQTWTPTQVVYEEGGSQEIAIGNPAPLVDRNTGNVWLLFVRKTDRVFYGRSLNEGTTWSARTEITSSVKLPTWSNFIATGPGHATQLPSGRFVFPSYHGVVGAPQSAYIIFSDDAGQTWRIGQDVGLGSGEPSAAVLSDGRLMINTRSPRQDWRRTVGLSNDWGFSWSGVARDPNLIEPTCQGSLLEARTPDGNHALLFSNPESVRRERMTIKASTDDGQTWPGSLRVFEGSSAYSDLVALNDNGDYGVLYERIGYGTITFSPFHINDVLPPAIVAVRDQWMIQ